MHTQSDMGGWEGGWGGKVGFHNPWTNPTSPQVQLRHIYIYILANYCLVYANCVGCQDSVLLYMTPSVQKREGVGMAGRVFCTAGQGV